MQENLPRHRQLPRKHKVTLVIIFNHQFNDNIPLLWEMYRGRFASIVFLVPFFRKKNDDMDRFNIIPVFESSYRFEGYIAQAYSILQKFGSDHYIFIGDDLILNPSINEDNYAHYFFLDKTTSFLTEICKINEPLGRYTWTYERVYVNVRCFGKERFVNYKKELPAPVEAFEIAKKKGFSGFVIRKKIYRRDGGMWGLLRDIGCKLRRLPNELPYPLFAGYSDLFVIDRDSFTEFSHYCGVFAAMGLFVEIAIPTAMVLACSRFSVQSDTQYERGDMWGMDNKRKFCEGYGYSLSRLLKKWDKRLLFVHPVKLSQWSEVRG